MQINNFFETLSQTLWSIEKHPFRKPGQLQKGGDQMQLSYDPSRVFKNQDDQNPFENDNEYIEFQRQQRFNSLLHDKNRLVQDLKQKQQKIKIRQSQIVRSKRDIYNPFIHERERCTTCSECRQFEGNFRMNKVGNVGIFCCMNCGCPMNTHREIVKDKLFSGMLFDYLKDKDLSDESMYANMFVVGLSIADRRNVELGRVINVLGQGGYTVLSYQEMNSHQFEQKFIEKMLFSQKTRTHTMNEFESLLNFVKFTHTNSSSQTDFSNFKHQESLGNKIKEYEFLSSRVKQELKPETENILCLLVYSSRNKRSNYYKFMQTVSKLLKNVTPFYNSPNNYQSLIDSQIFFPSYFKIRYQVFLPLVSSDKTSYAIKDMLDLNQYIIVRDGVDNVKRMDAEKALKQIGNPYLADSFLVTSIVSETVSHLDVKFVAKTGTPQLTTFGEIPPFIRFQETKIIESMMKNLCGKLLESQRCVIILRPALVSFGLDNLILNYLRINDFNIIGRTNISLNPQQMRMMEIFENISPEDSKNYGEMMKGLIQVILVTKRRAIMEAKILSEGCSYGIKHQKARVIRQQPQFHLQINNKQYIQELNTFQPKYWQQSQTNNIFNGIKNMFNIEKMIFGSSDNLQSAQLVEAETGSVIKEFHPYDQHKKKINSKMKQALLEEMNTEIFNFWMYTSPSENISEEIVNEFMPECALYESICVVIKPGYIHMASLIKEAIESLKFKILFTKTLILSRVLAGELVRSLLVVKNQELEKSLIARYGSEKVEILCVAKESGRKEMLYFLRSFSLQSKKVYKETDIVTDEMLKEVLVPVWQQQHTVLELLHPILEDIEKSLTNINRLERNDLFNLLIYLVGSIVGQEVKQLPLKTPIGQLSYAVSKSPQQTKIQSWYYSLINRTTPLLVPLLFQHRQYGKLSFIVQSSIGEQLFKYIFRSYIQNKNQMTKGGRSLVLFIWAKKLSDMVTDLSHVEPPLNGYENIDKFGDVYRGEIPDDSFRMSEIGKVKDMIKEWLEKDREIVQHLERVLSKRGFEERCKLKNKRLLPQIDDGNLRAVRSSRLSKLVLNDEIEMIDPNNQLSRSAELLTINLYNIVPQQMPKYWLWCQVYAIILRYSQEGSRFKEPAEQFLELFIQVSSKQFFEDHEMLAIELFLELTKRHQQGQTYLLPLIKLGLLDFRRIGKLNQIDDTSGKKRKFIPKTDHSKKQQPSNNYLLETMNKFNQYVYNVYSDAPKPDQNSLYNKNDPLYRGWIKEKRMVNLIRDVSPEKEQRKGTYVEYEKKLNENQEELKRRVQKQAAKYGKEEEKILYDEEAGNKNIWYKKKIETSFKPKAKMDEAIQRQLIKLMMHKEQNS